MIVNLKTVIPLAGLLVTCLVITLYGVQDSVDMWSVPMSSSITSFRSVGSNEMSRQPQFVISRSPVLVLILTYMRSGSSLTGDILQHSPGALYAYEPLRTMRSRNTSTYTIAYANGTKRSPPFSFIKEATGIMYNWFTCNITRLPVIGLIDGFLRMYQSGLGTEHGIKTSMFLPCLTRESTTIKNYTKAIQTCAKQLQSICEDSPVRIIKTIRLELRNVKHLLEELPNLKIVHLVRDPRATLFSQSRFGMCRSKRGGWQGCANRLCKRIENNTLEVEGLIKKYPDRILPVLYENIAKHPLETSRKMYHFIGAEFTFDAESYIYNITLAGNKDTCSICTTRSNSSEHVGAWKRKMKRDVLQIVNKRCNYVLKHYKFDDFPVK